MPRELILKKVEQLKELLAELARLLETPLPQFINDLKTIRAAERNFELIVEVASDVNTQLLLDAGKKTPDTYNQSFVALHKTGVLPDALTKQLVESTKLRNILAHEYDFRRTMNASIAQHKRLSRRMKSICVSFSRRCRNNPYLFCDLSPALAFPSRK